MILLLSGLLCFSFYFCGCVDGATSAGRESAFTNESNLIPWVHFGVKSYYVGIHFEATFLEADQFCKNLHMELVRVESKEENDFLFKYIQSSNKKLYYWTAGSKLMDGKNWQWMTTGEVIKYYNWRIKSPDGPDTEYCLILENYKNLGLFFDDRRCHFTFNFICERDKRRPQGCYTGGDSNDKCSKLVNVYVDSVCSDTSRDAPC